MYGFPKDFDLSILVGQQLESITFAVYTMIVSFAPVAAARSRDSVTFTVTSTMAVVAGSSDTVEYVTFPVLSSNLPSLIGLEVTGVAVEDGGDVAVQFENGTVLTIFEDQMPYESYQISHDGNEYVV